MIELFRKTFGREPSYFGTAPGRVNLIGEHTDYNGGFVLPTAIPQSTRVALARRQDNLVKVTSRNMEGRGFEYRLGEEKKRGQWTDYVQGLTHLLSAQETITGFEAAIESDVPIGSGLSSSAALDVSMMKAVCEAFQISADAVSIAKFCQRIENEFVGAPVGIMDPMAVSLATFGTALFIDTRSLRYEKILLPVDRMELAIINSGVRHRNIGGGYAQRRQECEDACRILGVRQLRDVTSIDQLEQLPDVLRRRARHVFQEDQRVERAVAQLREGNLAEVGRLFNESHASMRDDYEISIPEINFLVETAIAQPGVFGARLTGGGFGGSMVILAVNGKGREVANRVLETYKTRYPSPACIMLPETV